MRQGLIYSMDRCITLLAIALLLAIKESLCSSRDIYHHTPSLSGQRTYQERRNKVKMPFDVQDLFKVDGLVVVITGGGTGALPILSPHNYSLQEIYRFKKEIPVN